MQKILTDSDSTIVRLSLYIAQLEQALVATQQKVAELEKNEEKKTEKK